MVFGVAVQCRHCGRYRMRNGGKEESCAKLRRALHNGPLYNTAFVIKASHLPGVALRLHSVLTTQTIRVFLAVKCMLPASYTEMMRGESVMFMVK